MGKPPATGALLWLSMPTITFSLAEWSVTEPSILAVVQLAGWACRTALYSSSIRQVPMSGPSEYSEQWSPMPAIFAHSPLTVPAMLALRVIFPEQVTLGEVGAPVPMVRVRCLWPSMLELTARIVGTKRSIQLVLAVAMEWRPIRTMAI